MNINRFCLIKPSVLSERLIIGIDMYDEIDTILINKKRILSRKLGISKNLNPWGFQGETYENIIKYLSMSTESEYYDEMKKDPALKNFLYKNDVLREVKEWENRHIEVRPEDMFRPNEHRMYISWDELSKMRREDMTKYYVSRAFVADDAYLEHLEAPYYCIRVSEKSDEGDLVSRIIRTVEYTEFLKNAKQFYSEDKAIEFAMKYGYELRKVGFEIIKIEGRKFTDYYYHV